LLAAYRYLGENKGRMVLSTILAKFVDVSGITADIYGGQRLQQNNHGPESYLSTVVDYCSVHSGYVMGSE